jgi:thiol-disulfide isomerase/thioredoxin
MHRRGNSTLAIIAIVFVVAIGGAAFYLLQGSSAPESTLPTPHSVTSNEEKTMDREDGMASDGNMVQDGSRYVMYSKSGYEEVKNQKHVLYFYANWCPTCRPVDAELQRSLNDIPEDLLIVRVNYNDSETDSDEESLANAFNITYQHTFVYIENGNEVTRWNGGGLSEIISQTQ